MIRHGARALLPALALLAAGVQAEPAPILGWRVVAAHPLHVIYHLQYFTLTAVTTHSGFEGLVVGDKNRLALGTFHHQMHHRYFECNYGGLEVPWDKWFGSFHDGTPAAHQAILDRRRRLAAKA